MKNKEIDSPFIEMVNKHHENAINKDRLEKMFSIDKERTEELREKKRTRILLIVLIIAIVSTMVAYSYLNKDFIEGCMGKGTSRIACEKVNN